MPIVEAQSAGKPVITTNSEPMSWVAGGAALLLNDPMDVEEYEKCMMALVENEQLREILVAKGFENLKRFSLDEVKRQYMQVYVNLFT